MRSFTTWGATIEGIETLDGKKFTITKWRKKHFPETKNPLDDKKQSILRSIESFKRRISDLEEDLKNIDSEYVNWT